VRSDLERQAREFAESVQNVLNATICTGIRIGVVSSADTKLVSIGYGVTGICDTPALFPVSLGRKKPRCWLKVGYQLSLDTSGRFLTVAVSAFEVYAATGAQVPLCRFDYERGKSGGYPEAHIQVHGESGALAAWTGVPNTRELERLHLPMGGRRYRVTLEDVIEFLITEKLADTGGPHDRIITLAPVQAGRERFHEHRDVAGGRGFVDDLVVPLVVDVGRSLAVTAR
jgi:hypothetical protein